MTAHIITTEEDSQMSKNKLTSYVINEIADLAKFTHNPHNLRSLNNLKIAPVVSDAGEVEGFELSDAVNVTAEYRKAVNEVLETFVTLDDDGKWLIKNKIEMVVTPLIKYGEETEPKHLVLEGNARLSIANQVVSLLGEDEVKIELKFSHLPEFPKNEKDIEAILWNYSVSGANSSIPVEAGKTEQLERLYQSLIAKNFNVEDAVNEATAMMKPALKTSYANIKSQFKKVKLNPEILEAAKATNTLNLDGQALLLRSIDDLVETTGKDALEIASLYDWESEAKALGRPQLKSKSQWSRELDRVKDLLVPPAPADTQQGLGTVTETQGESDTVNAAQAVPEQKAVEAKPSKIYTSAEQIEILDDVTEALAGIDVLSGEDYKQVKLNHETLAITVSNLAKEVLPSMVFRPHLKNIFKAVSEELTDVLSVDVLKLPIISLAVQVLPVNLTNNLIEDLKDEMTSALSKDPLDDASSLHTELKKIASLTDKIMTITHPKAPKQPKAPKPPTTAE